MFRTKEKLKRSRKQLEIVTKENSSQIVVHRDGLWGEIKKKKNNPSRSKPWELEGVPSCEGSIGGGPSSKNWYVADLVRWRKSSLEGKSTKFNKSNAKALPIENTQSIRISIIPWYSKLVWSGLYTKGGS